MNRPYVDHVFVGDNPPPRPKTDHRIEAMEREDGAWDVVREDGLVLDGGYSHRQDAQDVAEFLEGIRPSD